jgi:TolB protein
MKLYCIFIFFILIIHSGCNDDAVTSIEDPKTSYYIDYYPSWSPTGNKIAYVHSDTLESRAGLYIIDTNGSNNLMVYNDPYLSSSDYSQNGEWIAFDSRGQIYKIKFNGDSLTQLTFNGSNFFPSWSPDGKWIVFDSNIESPNGMAGIWKMRIDGSDKIRIAYEPKVGEIRMPKWSTSNNRIVVQKYILGTGADPEIALIDTLGNTLRIITNNNNFDIFPFMSPSITNCIFTQYMEGGGSQLYSINVDGTSLVKLTNTQGYTADFSPDGQFIVFCDSSPNNGRLWIMKKDGSAKKQLTY